MSNDNKPLTRLARYGVCHDDNMLSHAPMDDGYWTPWHIAEQRLSAAEADQQRAVDAALEDTATTERIAQRAALLQKDEHPEDAIYWQGRSDGHGVSLINIRSRIGTNPLADLQARIAELEAEIRTDEYTIADLNHQIEGFKGRIAELEALIVAAGKLD